jgi:hypothetical protein
MLVRMLEWDVVDAEFRGLHRDIDVLYVDACSFLQDNS